jgi:hypothetical protein
MTFKTWYCNLRQYVKIHKTTKIELETKEYEYGFYTRIRIGYLPIGLNEDIVRAISLRKEEPEWMTDWRIEAYRAWGKWNGQM